jgi:hypothetical protein
MKAQRNARAVVRLTFGKTKAGALVARPPA